MNAVTEVMDELRKALALVDQLGGARDKAERELAELQRRASEALAQAVEWQRERDQARDKYEALAVLVDGYRRERDEAQASLAQIRRVFGNAIAFDDARGDIVKMAEIAYRGACDGDKAIGELRDMTRQRDEAREEAASSLGMAKIADVKHGWKCAEVDMLRGVGCMEDGDGPCGVCRKCAYRRGAEAMREHIAEVAGRNAALEWVVELVRALPIPEET